MRRNYASLDLSALAEAAECGDSVPDDDDQHHDTSNTSVAVCSGDDATSTIEELAGLSLDGFDAIRIGYPLEELQASVAAYAPTTGLARPPSSAVAKSSSAPKSGTGLPSIRAAANEPVRHSSSSFASAATCGQKTSASKLSISASATNARNSRPATTTPLMPIARASLTVQRNIIQSV